MNTIAILPEQGGEQPTTFSAVFGERTATGRTAGEALDALTSQLSAQEAAATVIVQQFRPDNFFTAAQRDRLSELTARWRAARDAGGSLPPAEQAELERLVNEEVKGAAERAARIGGGVDTPEYVQRESDAQPVTAEGKLKHAVAGWFAFIFIISSVVILFGFIAVSQTVGGMLWVTVLGGVTATLTAVGFWLIAQREVREAELKIAQLQRELAEARERRGRIVSEQFRPRRKLGQRNP